MTRCLVIPFLAICMSFHTQSRAQEIMGSFDPGAFLPNDISFGYHDPYRNNYGFTYQSGNDITRLLLDSAFRVLKTRKFNSKDLSYYGNRKNRRTLIQPVVLPEGVYEVFGEEDSLYILEPSYEEIPDPVHASILLKATDKDERLLAVFPSGGKICALSASFKKSVLYLVTWKPGSAHTNVIEFPLSESNIEKSRYKEYSRDSRIVFSRDLFNPSVQPLNQTLLRDRQGPRLYYTDSSVFILMHVPYSLGVFTIHLDLYSNQISTHNYELNDLRINAGTNNAIMKHPQACLWDSLLVIKNISSSTYDYYFYHNRTHQLLRKLEATEKNIEKLVHSKIRQKGTWASAKEEKEFEKSDIYLKKGHGFLIPSSISADSITFTNLSIIPTTGVAGSLLDMFVPLPLSFSSNAGFYLSLLIPPLGPSRDKMIFFHSRFSLKNLEPSPSMQVTTSLDKMVDDSQKSKLFSDICLFIRRNKDFCFGYYSKEEGKIKVFRYSEEQR